MNESTTSPESEKEIADQKPTDYLIRDAEMEQLKKSFTYHTPKGDQAIRYEELRFLARALSETILKKCPPSRERSLALIHLEECSMWSNASIARNE